ncbi:MAG: lipoyl(octanoyl) transferase LipB, partial [Dehalococcoidia bacterium]
MRRCQYIELGLVEYGEAWEFQRALAEQVHQGQQPDTLLLLEHPHVYTIGRRGQREEVLLDDEALAQRGVALHWVDRGGEVTYHGPGQLVGYPIVDIRSLGGPLRFVRALERIIIRTLGDLGVQAQPVPGHTGVWVGEEKVAAIGLRISRGIVTHGFALNVNTDLSYFEHIVPCGITDRGVTSLERLLGRPVEMGLVIYSLTYHFGRELGLKMVPV